MGDSSMRMCPDPAQTMNTPHRYASADAMVRAIKPDLPVRGVRPHVSARAAAWFLENFPGDVVYALKANDAPKLVTSLTDAGISHFDVASLSEIEKATGFGPATIHYMNPVKPRKSIARAYFEYGVRSFAIDSIAELEKVTSATNNAEDLRLFVRIGCSGDQSAIPLDRKYGAQGDAASELLKRARRQSHEIGITFHVGSQAHNPDAFTAAMAEAEKIIVRSGVLVDIFNIGGGFPSLYPGMTPPSLEYFMECILGRYEQMALGGRSRLMCEPGRALVAEAESVIVMVDARRGNELFISDGAFGMLYDAAHTGFTFPARRLGDAGRQNVDLSPFSLWGPSCDSIDYMKGPFLLPDDIAEGDYIEIGQIGAYGRTLASGFCGYGQYRDVVLEDEPQMSMFLNIEGHEAKVQDLQAVRTTDLAQGSTG